MIKEKKGRDRIRRIMKWIEENPTENEGKEKEALRRKIKEDENWEEKEAKKEVTWMSKRRKREKKVKKIK